MKRKSVIMLAVAAGLGSLAMSLPAKANIVLTLSNPAGSNTTVSSGAVIHAEWSASTDNSNGIHDIQGRIDESLTSGGSPQTAPYNAQVENSTTINVNNAQADLCTFSSSFYQSSSNVVLAKPTAKFNSNGTVNTTNALYNQPLFGFTAQSSSGEEEGDLYSPGNAAQTEMFDISFAVNNTGTSPITIFFNPSTGNNGGVGHEYTDGLGDVDTANDVGTYNGGFQVTINPVAVPEPASMSLIGLGAFGLLARWRRTAR
jgi:hypothetical protein